MIRISHIALWVDDLERMKGFYCRYFNGTAGEKYQNVNKHFESYFVKLDSGVSIELMHKTDQILTLEHEEIKKGFHHLAFSVESRYVVNNLTSILEDAGFEIISNPRFTGDGYYESVILDPEGNTIEITA